MLMLMLFIALVSLLVWIPVYGLMWMLGERLDD